jgi:SAM-dependent methyltransferase
LESVSIDPTAAEGFAAGAGAYERARPTYPAAAVDRIFDRLPPHARVLDLGAGTGKLTTLLAVRAGEVFAVEPIEQMRVRLAHSLPSVRVVAGTAEAIPLADGSFDAVLCAQAFHWFDAGPALAEIHRVLRRGGLLGLIWNARDRDVAWVDRMSVIVDSYGDAIRRHESGEWRAAFEVPNGFSPLEHDEFPNVQEVTGDQVLERVASTSFIAMLPEDERATILDQVRDVLTDDPSTRGTFAFPHRTRVYCCNRV